MRSLAHACLVAALGAATAWSADDQVSVNVNWNKVTRESRTTATLQVVVNPALRPGSPIHDRAYAEVRRLGADYVRYVPWLPYPKLAVAELRAPDKQQTYWDFSLIDPMTVDFLNATAGHPVIMNFSTIPAWMFKTPDEVKYPDDPEQVMWDYTKGTELRDATMRELAAYYARLVSWYTRGGFTDELGKRHESGHHFNIDYWEVLNEVDFEHNMTPEQYTARYDAVVAAIRKVAPHMKFVGLALADPARNPRMFEYFLNRKNHKRGIPLDMISYHFYATPAADQTPEVQPYIYFTQADRFLAVVGYIEAIRQRLSPATRTAVDEIGAILPGDPGQAGRPVQPIPTSYWNLAGATYAYVYGNLAAMGIDIAAESQLVGYPTQFPSVTMVDWNNGAPNARFRVLELIHKHFAPGDELLETSVAGGNLYAQAFRTRAGKREVLLVNQRDRPIAVALPGAATWEYVDQSTASGPAASTSVKGSVTLNGLAAGVATLD
ncbi:MAG: GH39 family glycosyl hydrolase [Bryobacteraceae bacterium]